MPSYSNFSDFLLVGMHQDRRNAPAHGYLNLKEVADRYGLEYETGWLREFKENGENRGLLKGPRADVGEENIVARLTGSGMEKVELKYMDINGDVEVLTPVKVELPAASPLAGSPENLIAQLIPASDRIITASHNLPDYVEALEKVQEARRLIAQSNQLSEEEKQDTIVHLDAGIGILSQARNFAVGAIRYLILDRLKKAFEGVIEDAFKGGILGAFMALATLLIWLIGS